MIDSFRVKIEVSKQHGGRLKSRDCDSRYCFTASFVSFQGSGCHHRCANTAHDIAELPPTQSRTACSNASGHVFTQYVMIDYENDDDDDDDAS